MEEHQEEYQEGLGGSFQVILDLTSVMALKLDSNMTCGVGVKPSRLVFWTCSIWPVVRMPSWHIISSFLVTH
jgi:hypothetical protein